MFMISLKASTLKLFGVLAALAVVVAAASFEGEFTKRLTAELPTEVSAQAVAAKEVTLSTNEQRIAFLKSLGWEVISEPSSVSEVMIPQTFNKVYNNYNAIQKEQGYDLTKYRGVRAKRWTYSVSNYPGVKDGVCANLLVCEDKLIGGDISSVALDGFMKGLCNNDSKLTMTPSSADIVTETFNTAD